MAAHHPAGRVYGLELVACTNACTGQDENTTRKRLHKSTIKKREEADDDNNAGLGAILQLQLAPKNCIVDAEIADEISKYVMEEFASHRNDEAAENDSHEHSPNSTLTSIKISNIELDESGLDALQRSLLPYADSVQHLSISNVNRISSYSDENIKRRQELLGGTRNNSSLVCRLAFAFQTLTLESLELKGDCNTNDSDMRCDEGDFELLCSVLQQPKGAWRRIRRLELSNLGLTDTHVQCLASALAVSKPPLEHLDLSRNKLFSQGLKHILAIINLLAEKLLYLNLESTGMDTPCAVALFSSLGRLIQSQKVKLCIEDNNPLNMIDVALSLANANHQLEQEQQAATTANNNNINGHHYDDHTNNNNSNGEDQKTIRNLLAAQAAMVSDIQALQKENQKLKKNQAMGSIIQQQSTKLKQPPPQQQQQQQQQQQHRRSIQYPSSKTRHRFPDSTSSSSNRRGRSNGGGGSASGSPARILARSASNSRSPPRMNIRPRSACSQSPSRVGVRGMPPEDDEMDKKPPARANSGSGILSREEVRAKVMAQMANRKKQQQRAAESTNGAASNDTASDLRAHILQDVQRLRQEQQSRRLQQRTWRQNSCKSLDSPSQYAAATTTRTAPNFDLPTRSNSFTLRDNNKMRLQHQKRLQLGEDESSGPEVLLPESITTSTAPSRIHHPRPTVDRRSHLHRTSSDRFQRLLRRQLNRESSFRMLPAMERYRAALLRRSESSRSIDAESSLSSSETGALETIDSLPPKPQQHASLSSTHLPVVEAAIEEAAPATTDSSAPSTAARSFKRDPISCARQELTTMVTEDITNPSGVNTKHALP